MYIWNQIYPLAYRLGDWTLWKSGYFLYLMKMFDMQRYIFVNMSSNLRLTLVCPYINLCLPKKILVTRLPKGCLPPIHIILVTIECVWASFFHWYKKVSVAFHITFKWSFDDVRVTLKTRFMDENTSSFSNLGKISYVLFD